MAELPEIKDPVVPATFTQEQVDAMIAEKVAGLKANKNDILDEKKALVVENKTIKEQYDEQQRVAKETARQALIDKGNLDELQKVIQSDVKKEFNDKLTAQDKIIKDLLAANEQSKTDSLLGSFVSQLGVSPIHAVAFDSYIKGAGLKQEEGVLTIGGLSTSDWKTSFLASEYGQAIIVPPQSSGGSAVGGGSAVHSLSKHEQVMAAALAGHSSAFGYKQD